MLFAEKNKPLFRRWKEGKQLLMESSLAKEKKLEVCFFLIFNYEFRFFFIEAANCLQ